MLKEYEALVRDAVAVYIAEQDDVVGRLGADTMRMGLDEAHDDVLGAVHRRLGPVALDH